jgi:hypothetical protein
MSGLHKGARVGMAVLSLMVALGSAGCDGDSPTAAQEEMDVDVLVAMEAGIQDEFRAELIYEGVLNDFGDVRPFSNIINAEVRHSDAIALLYSARGLPVPASQWSGDEIPSFSSVTEACRAGVTAEIENAEVYDRYLGLPLPDDVRMVFENNRAASLEKHLPAFQRCSS